MLFATGVTWVNIEFCQCECFNICLLCRLCEQWKASKRISQCCVGRPTNTQNTIWQMYTHIKIQYVHFQIEKERNDEMSALSIDELVVYVHVCALWPFPNGQLPFQNRISINNRCAVSIQHIEGCQGNFHQVYLSNLKGHHKVIQYAPFKAIYIENVMRERERGSARSISRKVIERTKRTKKKKVDCNSDFKTCETRDFRHRMCMCMQCNQSFNLPFAVCNFFPHIFNSSAENVSNLQ